MRSKIFGLVAVTMAAFAVLVMTAHAATNLISNNSFEVGTATTATGWTADRWGSNKAAFSMKTGDAKTGTRSSYVQVSSYAGGDASWRPASIDVAGGETYVYSNWYKSNVRTEVDAEIVMSDGTMRYLWLGDVAASGTTWKQLTYKLTLPANSKKLVIYHLIARNGWLQTDEYNLEKQGTVATPPPTTTVTPPPTTTVTPPPTTTVTPPPTTTVTPPPTTTVTPPPTTTVTPPPAPAGAFSRPLVSIEFDDGWGSAYRLGLPTVESFGWKPTQYIITDTALNNANYGTGTYMTPSEVIDWNRRGDIGAHTRTHADLTSLSQSAATAEMTQSKQYLDTLLGEPTRLFATPYCSSNATVTAIAQTLYQDLRNCDPEVNLKSTFNRWNVKTFIVLNTTTDAEITALLNQAKANNGWLVLTWHEIAGDNTNAWSVSQPTLARQLQLVKNSGISVVTTQQALNESLGL